MKIQTSIAVLILSASGPHLRKPRCLPPLNNSRNNWKQVG